jgi:4-methyl-5(b-hydroxyethyl)-thiazole monophosphate biosynthesis
MVYLFLADGFEEIEALTPLDMLRRAQIPVCTVGVGGKNIRGAHDIIVRADILPQEVNYDDMIAIILPGGMPGTLNLEKSDDVQSAISYALENKLVVAAICAAPSVLGHAGFLKGRKATCFPGFEKELVGATIADESVTWDGDILTAKGAGVALDFALELVARLSSKGKSEELRGAIQCR